MSYVPPQKEKLLVAYDQAPKLIQDALTNGPAVKFSLSLAKEYGLSDVFCEAITFMGRDVLLGLLEPIQFDKNLKELLTEDKATRLLKDFNAKVLSVLINKSKPVSVLPSKTPGDAVPTQRLASPVAPHPLVPEVRPPAPLPAITSPQPFKLKTFPNTSPVPAVPVAPLNVLQSKTSGDAVQTQHLAPVVSKPINTGPVMPPLVPNLSKEGVPPHVPPVPTVVKPPTTSVNTPPIATGPKTPIVNKYVADPYKEPLE